MNAQVGLHVQNGIEIPNIFLKNISAIENNKEELHQKNRRRRETDFNKNFIITLSVSLQIDYQVKCNQSQQMAAVVSGLMTSKKRHFSGNSMAQTGNQRNQPGKKAVAKSFGITCKTLHQGYVTRVTGVKNNFRKNYFNPLGIITNLNFKTSTDVTSYQRSIMQRQVESVDGVHVFSILVSSAAANVSTLKI